MTLRPSTAPQRVPLPSPHASSLLVGPDPASDSLCAASPAVTRLLATTVTDPLFESTAASALVTELDDFAAACRLDYAARLVTESESVSVRTYVDEVPPPGANIVSGMWIFRVKRPPGSPPVFKARYVARGFSQRQGVDFFQSFSPTPKMTTLRVLLHVAAQRDYELHSLDFSTAFLQGSLHEEIWLRRPPGFTGSFPAVTQVKRPPGSPPVFKARYVARGFSQRQGVDFFHTFSPTPKMTTLWVLLHVAAQRDYELHSLDFSTAFLQGSLHEEIWLRRPPGFTGSFPAGTQWSLRRPLYGLRQAPREWHDTLRTTLASLGFAPSTADPSLFLRTDTTLPPFYVLVAQCTINLTQSHMVQQVLQRFGFTYSSPQSTPLPTGHSLSAPPSDESVEPSGSYPELVGYLICEAEIYAWAMAAQELRWLTYLLTDLGEAPRSRPVLYVDNKAMLALCQKHRLEHRTKHIALRYFLARELQQRGQLRLAYVASQANTSDVFTKALQPCDHHRFCTVLGLVPTVPHLLTS
ncbi:unnamed protein product [Closterium sp. NIES-54]